MNNVVASTLLIFTARWRIAHPKQSDRIRPLTAMRSESGWSVESEDASTGLVRSLQRGLAVIRSFSHGDAYMSVTEIARRANLSRATTRRLLLTREDSGYVRSDSGRFALRPTVLELGSAYFSSQLPWQHATAVMEQLGSRVQENCLAGVLDGHSVTCIARTSHRLVAVGVDVGRRIPAYTSSMGRVLLASLDPRSLDRYFAEAKLTAITDSTVTDREALRAELSAVREQGWSIVEDEVAEGLIGIAVPVAGPVGQVVAALNISAHDARVSREQALENLLGPLKDAAAEISLLLGSRERVTATVVLEA